MHTLKLYSKSHNKVLKTSYSCCSKTDQTITYFSLNLADSKSKIMYNCTHVVIIQLFGKLISLFDHAGLVHPTPFRTQSHKKWS